MVRTSLLSLPILARINVCGADDSCLSGEVRALLLAAVEAMACACVRCAVPEQTRDVYRSAGRTMCWQGPTKNWRGTATDQHLLASVISATRTPRLLDEFQMGRLRRHGKRVDEALMIDVLTKLILVINTVQNHSWDEVGEPNGVLFLLYGYFLILEDVRMVMVLIE